MSSKTSAEDREEFKKAFIIFDRDADGKISKEELGLALAALGRTFKGDALGDMMKTAGGGDSLDLAQFQTFMGNMRDGTATEKEIMDALEVFDKDKNGHIECRELKKAMMEMGTNPLSEAEADELIRRGNPEKVMGSSRIEYKPFVSLMMKRMSEYKSED